MIFYKNGPVKLDQFWHQCFALFLEEFVFQTNIVICDPTPKYQVSSYVIVTKADNKALANCYGDFGQF